MKIFEHNKLTTSGEFEAEVGIWRGRLETHRLAVLALGRSSSWVACFCAAMREHVQIVLIDPTHLSRVEGARDALPWDLWISESGMVERAPSLDVDIPGYVIFSSGTTGSPKCIHVPFTNLPKVIHEQIRLMGLGGHVVAWCLSPGFDASISDVLCALWSGGDLVIPEAPFTRLRRLSEIFVDRGVQYADIPPRVLELMAPDKFPSLKKILVGGEPLSSLASGKWADRVELWNSYGPTEATISTSMCRVDSLWPRAWLGAPLTGVTYRTTPDNELTIEGNLATGYLFDPEMTSQRFPVVKGLNGEDDIRVFKTGDKVGVEEGKHYFIGRMDTGRKRNGVFIFPEEVEAVGRSVGRCKARWIGDDLVLDCVGDTRPFQTRIQRMMPRWYWPSRYRETKHVEVSTNGKAL